MSMKFSPHVIAAWTNSLHAAAKRKDDTIDAVRYTGKRNNFFIYDDLFPTLPTHRPSYGIRRLGNKGYGFYVVAQGPKIVKSYRASRAESERRFTARLLARRIKT